MTVDIGILTPTKYTNPDYPIFPDFITVANEVIGEWNTAVTELLTLLDPYNVDDGYLQHLADLIGFVLTSEDDATVATRRQQLLNAIDWYKVRGTYQSLAVIALMFNSSFTIYDMYTNDYATFIDEEWFVGDEGENPPGLDATYYKSPHFGIAWNIDRVYAAGTYEESVWERHLWRPELFTGVSQHVEKTRPVNTVPHYKVTLQAETDESGAVSTITETEVATRIINWTYTKLFFDAGGDGSGQQVYFDEAGNYFDMDFSAFIGTITTWKLGSGTGSGYLDLDGAAPYSLDLLGIEGIIDRTTVYEDRIVFEFDIPEALVQNNINQIGLYAGASLVVASTFPDVNKGAGVSIKVVVTVYRETG